MGRIKGLVTISYIYIIDPIPISYTYRLHTCVTHMCVSHTHVTSSCLTWYICHRPHSHSDRSTQIVHSVAVCCSVLQCVAVCCSRLQCVAVCCSGLQCVADRSTQIVHSKLSVQKWILVMLYSTFFISQDHFLFDTYITGPIPIVIEANESFFGSRPQSPTSPNHTLQKNQLESHCIPVL